MKKLVFVLLILITSNVIYSQNEIEIRKGLTNISMELTVKDSLMLDSIMIMIETSKKMFNTILELQKSNYSENLIRFSYRQYAEYLNEIYEHGLLFLAVNGITKGIFFLCRITQFTIQIKK